MLTILVCLNVSTLSSSKSGHHIQFGVPDFKEMWQSGSDENLKADECSPNSRDWRVNCRQTVPICLFIMSIIIAMGISLPSLLPFHSFIHSWNIYWEPNHMPGTVLGIGNRKHTKITAFNDFVFYCLQWLYILVWRNT